MTALLAPPVPLVDAPPRDALLVTEPTQITPAWLNSVLRVRSSATEEVVDCDVKRIAEGSALLGRVYRVALRYRTEESTGPDSVVVKIATTDPEQLLAAELLGFYHREVWMYTNIAGQLPYRTPEVFLAAVSDDGRATTLVLEDLRRARPVDQVRGAMWREVCLGIDALAAQHARFENTPLVSSVGSVCRSLSDPVYPTVLPMLFEPGWELAREVCGDRISPQLSRFGDRWSVECGELLRRLMERPTLLHGDFRADNLFVDRGGLIVTDFQIAGLGAGAFDLAYFVSQSVGPTRRRSRDLRIVERYVAGLGAHGAPSRFGTTWREYRTALLACLVYPVAAFRSWESKNPRGRALIEAMFTRAAATIESTEALELVSDV